MARETFVFLDFDETLSDAQAFRPQYVREMAQALAREVGGSAGDWAPWIAPAWSDSVARYEARFCQDPRGYCAWIEEERVRVTEAVLAGAGRTLPGSESVGDFIRRVEFDVLTGCSAPLPGAADALLGLFEAGVRVQMASSQESQYLLAALIGAGIESYVESKFGPDLVDCAKEGPEFFRRIFAASGADPARCIVVDDLPICLRWAREAGARTIQARLLPHAPPAEFPVVLQRLADLPGLVQQMTTQASAGLT